MSKKDRDSMEELWSKRFDEEADLTEDEPMSRKAKREREQGISPILTVTVIFLALLIILPISAYAWFINREDLSESPSSPSVEQVALVEDEEDEEDEEPLNDEEDDDEDEEEIEEEPEIEEEVEEEPEEVASQPVESANSSNTNQEASSPTPPETNESVSESEQETVSEPEQSESTVEPAEEVTYYTVSAGENMYRIALNHGMTTEELMQLNGLSDETVYIGQELRVK